MTLQPSPCCDRILEENIKDVPGVDFICDDADATRGVVVIL